MACKVGSFAKSTATAPVDQAVTGIGWKPRAIIFFTVGRTSSGSFGASHLSSLGFAARNAADTITEGSCGCSSTDALGTSDSSRYVSSYCIGITNAEASAVLAIADFKSFDDDGFTVTWSTNDANGYVINYIALGGPDLTDAKVVHHTAKTSTGNLAVTGVGFQPDCALHTSINASPKDTFLSTAMLCFGVMTSSAQWVFSHRANDAETTTSTGRSSSNAKCIRMLSNAHLVHAEAQYVSFDSDGFTLNWTTSNGFAQPIVSLCLKGGSYAAGVLTKTATAAPVNQSFGLSMSPDGILLASIGYTDHSSVTYDRFCLGASDGSNHAAASSTDKSSSTDSVVKSINKTDKAGVFLNNDTTTIGAEGTISFNSDATMAWTTNTPTQYLIGYIAFNLGAVVNPIQSVLSNYKSIFKSNFNAHF